MARYELQPDCLFVDAYNLEFLDLSKLERAPAEISTAHILDKRRKDAVKYLELDDVSGFITRFIVQGVETEGLLPQIIASEYSLPVAEAAREVQAVLQKLQDFLKPRETVRPYIAPGSTTRFKLTSESGVEQLKLHSGVYDLDFRVNWMFLGGFKLPL